MNSGTDRKEENPPHSRVFVVCSKRHREEDLRPRFESFGTIEDIYIPRDRNTGDSKGVAYIKFAKTSAAASAIKELHMKTIYDDVKPIKVMLAINRNGGPTQNENEDRYKRLFIKVSRDANETDIKNHFSALGQVESVYLMRDKQTDACKGFAYVVFKTFFDAACAYEGCDVKYKPMFATPKDDLKRSRNNFDHMYQPNPRHSYNERFMGPQIDLTIHDTLALPGPIQDYHTIVVKCSPVVSQKHIELLFNIVPGMKEVQYSVDSYNGLSKAVITYQESKSAAYAVDRLNNFEYPSGEILSVKPYSNPLAKAAKDLTSIVNHFKNAGDTGNPYILQLADAIVQASSLMKAATTGNSEVATNSNDHNFCSVNLPPHKELANINSTVAQRLFIICKPHPPPISALQDVFCRFGDLIDVSTFPHKTFGFAKYASTKAAQEALNKLNGAIICGIRLKVLEADEKPNGDKKRNDSKLESMEYDMDSKRMKLDNDD